MIRMPDGPVYKHDPYTGRNLSTNII